MPQVRPVVGFESRLHHQERKQEGERQHPRVAVSDDEAGPGHDQGPASGHENAGRQLHDVAGEDGEIDIAATVRAFAGVFTLEEPSAIVGQRVVVRASGLPSGSSFAMQFRLNDEPVAKTTTRTGNAQLSFPLPSTSPGTAHVDVTHNGLTIASLPFEITLVPTPLDTSIAPWGLLAIPFVVLVGFFVGRRIRRRRRLARASSDPSDGASTMD